MQMLFENELKEKVNEFIQEVNERNVKKRWLAQDCLAIHNIASSDKNFFFLHVTNPKSGLSDEDFLCLLKNKNSEILLNTENKAGLLPIECDSGSLFYKIREEDVLNAYLKAIKNYSPENKRNTLEKIIMIAGSRFDEAKFIDLLEKIQKLKLSALKVNPENILRHMVIKNPLLIESQKVLEKIEQIYENHNDFKKYMIAFYNGDLKDIGCFIARIDDIELLQEAKHEISLPFGMYEYKRKEKTHLIDKRVAELIALQEKSILTKVLDKTKSNFAVKKRI